MKKWTNVKEVMRSIEKFWYNSFVTVDKEHTIINGHSRYKALKELWWEKIKVIVVDQISEVDAKEYRILDNKIQDMNEWDTVNLDIELRLFEWDEYMEWIFWVIESKQKTPDPIWIHQVNDKKQELTWAFDKKSEERQEKTRTATCPHCLEDFDISV